MGLAELILGKENPFTQWVGGNQNFLGALGSGIAQGQNIQSGLAAGAAMIPQAKQLDREAAEKVKAEKLAEQQANATTNWLQANHPDLADAVTAGMPVSEAWSEAMRRMQPQGGLEPTANMRDFQFAQANPGFAEFLNPAKQPSMPTSYQEYLLAQENPEYAKSLSSSSTKPPTEGERRNNQLATVIGPELDAVEQKWAALTDAGNQIKGAEMNGARPGLAFTSPEYQQAINSLSTIVASYLYSVSGATATDAEIKRQVDLLTPKLGESELSTKAKLDRIRTYAKAVTDAAGRAGSGAVLDDPLGIR